MKVVVLLCAVCVCAAFKSSSVNRASRTTLRLQAKSQSLPFMDAPAALDGSLVGDVGFDPLGFTNTITDMKYVRAAELKHGRVAMLAVVGFLVGPTAHFIPVDNADPFKVIGELGLGANMQVTNYRYGYYSILLYCWHLVYC